MYQVRYWDGSKELAPFMTLEAAIEAAKRGLQGWMNDDDDLCVLRLEEGNAEVWVAGGSEGPSDARASITYIGGAQ